MTELRTEFEEMLSNAPAEKGASVDALGRPVKVPAFAWQLTEPLRDEFTRVKMGVYNFNGGEQKPRHNFLMQEPEPPQDAPKHVVQNLMQPLAWMDSALRAYGHPDLLRIAEAVNGPDFCPFSEIFWIKPARLGSSTSWHQDPSSAWDEAWTKPGFDVDVCGFSFHIPLYDQP